jgi:Na+:H+ antiporter, NhaA family
MRTPNRPSLFQTVVAPLQAFFRLEAASGILLMASAIAAMIWANSPAAGTYRALLNLPIEVGVSGHTARFTLEILVNDGLMAIFFLVVGMEIKRELVIGELRTFSRAMLPAIAALGGMIVPALIYLAFTRGTPASVGWGIPMATDIAFSIGVLTLLKRRIPNALIVFLTALAIFDDLGGILVIALFYGEGLHASWLGVAAGITAALYGINRRHVRSGLVYAAFGAALWYALHHAGIHATISGVILGMMVPARARRPSREVLVDLHEYTTEVLAMPGSENLDNQQLLAIEERIEDLEPPLNRFVHMLHPYVAFVIIPVFALVNSGVAVAHLSAADVLSAVPLAVALGLFFGKQLGIFAFTWAAVRLGVAPMPGKARLSQLYGVAIVGGIGFTVALFIASLAFPDSAETLDRAKLGILIGSLASGLVGYAVLRLSRPTPMG